MTKADIVNEISKSTGIDKASVLETVERFMDIVKDSLANDENVYLRGFGSFIIKTRSQYLTKYHYHHPRTQNSSFQAS